MRKYITFFAVLFLSLPLHAGYNTGDEIGMDNPATADLEMNGYRIYVDSIQARDTKGLYLLNSAGNGVYIDGNGGHLSVGNTVGTYFIALGSYSFTGGVGLTDSVPRIMTDNVYDDAGTPSVNKFCFCNIPTFVAGIGFSLYDFDLITGNNGNFRFHTGCTNINGTGATEIFTILKNGYVGISDSDPNTKFVIKDGSITISGTNSNLILDGFINLAGQIIAYDDTNYKIDIPTNTVIDGTLTVGTTFYYRPAHVSYYIAPGDSAATNVAGSTETFTGVQGTLTAFNVQGFSVAGTTVTYNGYGGSPKIFDVDINASVTSDTNNVILHWAFYKNGTQVICSIQSNKILTGTDIAGTSIHCQIVLSAGDQISYRVSGNASAAITHDYINLRFSQIN